MLDYYDQLKSRTRGYASFDYDFAGFRPGDARARRRARRRRAGRRALADHPPRLRVRPRPRCSSRSCARRSRARCSTSPIQAAIGSRVIARETVKAKRKDVLAKCYGGDISRKRKLLEKQKEGKKRMKQVGAVEVPQEAFLAVLNLDQDEEVMALEMRGACERCGTALEPDGDGDDLLVRVHVLRRRAPTRWSTCARTAAASSWRGRSERRAHDAARATSTSTCRSARTAAATATSSPRSGGATSTRRTSTRCSPSSSWSADALAPRLETIFLGGGTPTFTEPAALERLLAALPDADEVTVEANPETVTPELARLLPRNRCQPRVARRAELPAAAPGRARAARAARRRPARRARSS